MDSQDEILKEILRTKAFAWDLEAVSTTENPKDAVIPHKARLTHIAIASPTKAACWDADEKSIAFLCSLLTNPDLHGLVFNAPYDYKLMHYDGHLDIHNFKCKLIDVMGLVYLCDEEAPKGLKFAAKKYCDITMTTFEEVTATSKAAKKLEAIRTQHAGYQKNLTQWTAKVPRRPWPTWNFPTMTRTAIRKELRMADPELKPKDAKAQVDEMFLEEHLDEYRIWVEQQVESDAKKISELEAEVNEHMKEYARDDAANLFKLYAKTMAIISEENTQHVIPIEMEMQQEVIEMSIRGVNLDVEKLEDLKVRMTALKDKFEARIYDLAKREFKINSGDELKQVLFGELLIPVPSVTTTFVDGEEIHLPSFTTGGTKIIKKMVKEGDYSFAHVDCRYPENFPDGYLKVMGCDVKVLSRIQHPIAQAILDYRVVEKLLSTYVDNSFRDLEYWGDGKLHPIHKNFATVTNRWSCSEPNTQTLPGKGKGDSYDPDIQYIGMELRDAFVAPPADEIAPEGYGLIQCDLSQIELRVSGEATEDVNLRAIYNEHVLYQNVKFYTGDIHAMTSDLLGCPRKNAKAANFSSSYGVGPLKFAQMNGLFTEEGDYDLDLAAFLIHGFFDSYIGVKNLMKVLESEFSAGERLFPTIAGRFRHFYDQDRGRGFRPSKGKIFNSIIQGSAGDILKYVMYIIRKYIYPQYPGARIILQIHDEVILCCPKRYIREVAILVKYCMEYPWFPLSVPLFSGAKIVDRWGDASLDSVPEVGVFYAEIEGEPKIFSADNWDEYIKFEDEGKVTKKASGAQLTPKQIAWASTKIPKEMPPAPKMVEAV